MISNKAQEQIAKIDLMGETVWLLPQRAIFIPRLKTIILSDLHFGKINHFRRAGIAVPSAANHANTENLVKLIMDFSPERMIFIGDLFHSAYNDEWEVLGQVIKNFTVCSFELVPGNHDILSALQYEKNRIKLHGNRLSLTDRITLVHDPVDNTGDGEYFISGHIHPAITLNGKGRQSLTFPCFWFGKQQALLPAFGVFTGFKPIKPENGDKVFAIVEDELVEVSTRMK